MSPFNLFVGSLVAAVVGLVLATIGTVRTIALKPAMGSAANPGLFRAHRRWMVLALSSGILFVLATAFFFYIWISCAGEC